MTDYKYLLKRRLATMVYQTRNHLSFSWRCGVQACHVTVSLTTLLTQERNQELLLWCCFQTQKVYISLQQEI